MKHATRGELEAILLATPPGAADDLRSHVASCPSCTERLTQDAILEDLLFEAGRSMPVAKPDFGRRKRGLASRPRRLAAAVVAIAALGAVWFLAVRDRSKVSDLGTNRYASLPASPATGMDYLSATPGFDSSTPGFDSSFSGPSTAPGLDLLSPADLCRDVSISMGGPGL